MDLNLQDAISIAAALSAVLIVGSRHLDFNLNLYCLQTVFIATATAFEGWQHQQWHYYLVALAIFAFKACGIPAFLNWIGRRIDVQTDAGTILPAPLAMHLSIALFAMSYFIGKELLFVPGGDSTISGAAAGLSLLFTGMLLMLTRRIALGQIIGFLTMENGIFLLALTQTTGMPMMVEMGILLDVLVGVMITGLLLFRIKSSFEHIDVSQLTELKD